MMAVISLNIDVRVNEKKLPSHNCGIQFFEFIENNYFLFSIMSEEKKLPVMI